jgi:ADP-ribosylglycohydrolase
MTTPTVSFDQRVLGALWGALVGDALGVPVEFMDRASVRKDPVTAMRGYGTHRQPPGTWSDDSSLLLCTAESLEACQGFNPADLGTRFRAWESSGYWTPYGSVFDIGIATFEAIARLASGVEPETAGGLDEFSNGNGSLMRILPIALWFHEATPEDLARLAGRASSLTHQHPRSRMACALYCLVVRELLRGANPAEAYRSSLAAFAGLCEQEPFRAERPHFQQLEAGRLGSLPERAIDSGGYVIHTLTASLWCLLTSGSFEETVLKAVNLGHDTDTTGTVAGGLAGALYGVDAIPLDWRKTLARSGDVEVLFAGFLRGIPPAAT